MQKQDLRKWLQRDSAEVIEDNFLKGFAYWQIYGQAKSIVICERSEAQLTPIKQWTLKLHICKRKQNELKSHIFRNAVIQPSKK